MHRGVIIGVCRHIRMEPVAAPTAFHGDKYGLKKRLGTHDDSRLARRAEWFPLFGLGGEEFGPLIKSPAPEGTPVGIGKSRDLRLLAAVRAGHHQQIVFGILVELSQHRSAIFRTVGVSVKPEFRHKLLPMGGREGRHVAPSKHAGYPICLTPRLFLGAECSACRIWHGHRSMARGQPSGWRLHSPYE